MLRALLVLIALALIVLIVLTYMGIINLTQTQPAQAPAFQVSVKPVEVGTKTTNVQVPAVQMKSKQIEVPVVRVGNDAQPVGNQQ